ncbi:MAG: S-adenosyl-l-methionine hydroxide adenosyltransferase family protein [Thermoplasmatales archaeon]|nr:MAG: S-adenosyl-l-methionine hydroxide adenosyltransferase family protein [Thermoplasmatales archaeon]
MRIITFLTDFGKKNSYVSQMKGVASSMTDAKLIDITHEITPHNIKEGAFALLVAIPYFPIGTVHVGVVDPDVGPDEKGIIITTRSQILVGPDNGLLIPAARSLGDFIVYEIKNEKYMLDSVSNTFHGRDIFTPIAAHIINGIPFEKIGPITSDFVDLDFGKCEITNKTATGKIIHVDQFGNIITNIDGIKLRKILNYDKKIMAFIANKKQEMSFVRSYFSVKKGKVLSTIGSSNFLEIAINQGNAAKKLGIKYDDEIKILFN